MPESLLNFIKKETLAQVFFFDFCEISKNNFFTEHLLTTASLRDTVEWGRKCLVDVSVGKTHLVSFD